METENTYYPGLIARYLCGEATPDEIHELEDWVKSDTANKVQFQSIQKTWKTAENIRIESTLDLDHEWKTLKLKLPEQQTTHRTSFLFPNQLSSAISWTYRIAAMFLLLLVPAFLIYRSQLVPEEIRVASATGTSEFMLPDGSRITLNEGASLSYPQKFDGSVRKVTLFGEAWFEVAHDAKKPFVVTAGNAVVQVLGTTFLLNSNAAGNNSEVILASGKVKVFRETDPGQPVFLAPGDKAIVNAAQGEIIKKINEDANFLAWKTKHLIFINMPLNEVVAQLAKVYHTRILLSGNLLSDCRITATFDKQSLESVLNVLKETLDLQVRNSGNGVVITGEGCN